VTGWDPVGYAIDRVRAGLESPAAVRDKGLDLGFGHNGAGCESALAPLFAAWGRSYAQRDLAKGGAG
jgi:hypothetical protein